MQNLVMIPALGCDGGLYVDILPRLSRVVEPATIVADKDTLTGCVQQVLERAPENSSFWEHPLVAGRRLKWRLPRLNGLKAW